VVHHQSRYALLQDVQEAEAEEPVPAPLVEHVSYGVQTRGMAKHIHHEPNPVPCGVANLKSPVDLLPSGSILSHGKDLLVHRREGHAQSHPDYTSCPMGKLQARRTPFRHSTDTRSPKPAGFRLAGDMKGPLRPDINGHMWHLVMVDMNSKYGYIHSLVSTHSAGAKTGVQKFWLHSSGRQVRILVSVSFTVTMARSSWVT